MRALPLTALLVLALAAPAGAGTYAGWITIPGGGAQNDDPLVFTTAGTRVRSVVVAFRARCDNGQSVGFHQRLTVGRTLVASRNAGGSFAASIRTGGTSGTHVFADRGAIIGTFNRSGARGTITPVIQVTDRASGAATTCSAGTLKWTARRRLGRYYGGMSSQGEPVVLTLTANRRSVYEFGIDLHGSCTPGGTMDMPDWINDFGVRNGRFGDSFRFRDKSGATHTYRWGGRLTWSAASGFVEMSIRTASGVTCRPGHLTWHLRSG